MALLGDGFFGNRTGVPSFFHGLPRPASRPRATGGKRRGPRTIKGICRKGKTAPFLAAATTADNVDPEEGRTGGHPAGRRCHNAPPLAPPRNLTWDARHPILRASRLFDQPIAGVPNGGAALTPRANGVKSYSRQMGPGSWLMVCALAVLLCHEVSFPASEHQCRISPRKGASRNEGLDCSLERMCQKARAASNGQGHGVRAIECTN